jgi:hypothetical protein
MHNSVVKNMRMAGNKAISCEGEPSNMKEASRDVKSKRQGCGLLCKESDTMSRKDQKYLKMAYSC